MAGSVNLYDNVYGDFGSDAERAVRREAYGEDLGQSSWLTASEWLEFAGLLGIEAGAEVLEVGSGSGGPAVYLAAARGCRVTGVDINQHGARPPPVTLPVAFANAGSGRTRSRDAMFSAPSPTTRTIQSRRTPWTGSLACRSRR